MLSVMSFFRFSGLTVSGYSSGLGCRRLQPSCHLHSSCGCIAPCSFLSVCRCQTWPPSHPCPGFSFRPFRRFHPAAFLSVLRTQCLLSGFRVWPAGTACPLNGAAVMVAGFGVQRSRCIGCDAQPLSLGIPGRPAARFSLGCRFCGFAIRQNPLYEKLRISLTVKGAASMTLVGYCRLNLTCW